MSIIFCIFVDMNNVENIVKNSLVISEKEKGVVYCAINQINNKIYFGITTTSLYRRKISHKHQSHNPKVYFHHALNKHGFNNFKWYTLFKSQINEELFKKEIELINRYKSNDSKIGYNLTFGGDYPKMNNETKLKISLKAKERNLISVRNPFYGKKHTLEMREHFSKIRKGIKPNNGFEKHTLETKQKLSMLAKERMKNPLFIRKMSLAQSHRVRLQCEQTNKIFESIKDASKSINMNYQTFKKYFKLGIKIKGLTYKKI